MTSGGFRSNSGRNSIIPVMDADKIQALADEGWSYNRLSILYGVSWSAVQRYFVRHELTYRIGHDGELKATASIAPLKKVDIERLYGTCKYENVSPLELRLERIFEREYAAQGPRVRNVAELGDPQPGRRRA